MVEKDIWYEGGVSVEGRKREEKDEERNVGGESLIKGVINRKGNPDP